MVRRHFHAYKRVLSRFLTDWALNKTETSRGSFLFTVRLMQQQHASSYVMLTQPLSVLSYTHTNAPGIGCLLKEDIEPSCSVINQRKQQNQDAFLFYSSICDNLCEYLT